MAESEKADDRGEPDDATTRMDRMYRHTRHVYDASRKFYLLGRDAMLRRMDLPDRAQVLEVGCGTGRNLIHLGKMRPDLRLFGLDASALMLDTAQKRIRRRGMAQQVTLRQGLAEKLDAARMFGIERGFDAIFFSYSLSMIPTWPEALHAAAQSLKPGRCIHIVDFWDQADLPRWLARPLQGWLSLFGVHHRPEMLDHLRTIASRGMGELTIEPYARRYAYLARFRVPVSG